MATWPSLTAPGISKGVGRRRKEEEEGRKKEKRVFKRTLYEG